MESSRKHEVDYYKNICVHTKSQKRGVNYRNMNPNNTNSDTQTKIQTPTTGGSNNATTNQGVSGTNQGTNG